MRQRDQRDDKKWLVGTGQDRSYEFLNAINGGRSRYPKLILYIHLYTSFFPLYAGKHTGQLRKRHIEPLRFLFMADPVVQLLVKQSKSRLNEMRSEAVRQIEDLQQQVAWIDRALAEKGASPQSGTSEPRTTAERSAHYRANGYFNAGRRRRTSQKRAAVEAIMATDPSKGWTYADILEALEVSGMESTIESVRVLMRRMLSDGDIVRGGPNDGFILPSAAIEARQDDQMSMPGSGAESALASTDRSE